MAITVNGEKKELIGKLTVAKLLEAHQLRPELTVVQLNEGIVPKGEYAGQLISDGDRID
ncbi:thiamine biosynthesis protein ThiS [Candidatus Saganbacteria bacterium CG08_land_8_20_14_0_20_45_16]|uniref:Thiamine biosynthesis protein ThiS n=1 Tax=Candidatus Saganbacteria bacterium CG08_land_8_20_14_0_20_45_16 TaxID=2014293 RepID=A0A2H0XXA2_UNCSA|nr:MAG: thiamine biosynthesis protein ThiS [Candidatus Saganbacteria bacterium CG08_land_8_20_14_0_20_45_16]